MKILSKGFNLIDNHSVSLLASCSGCNYASCCRTGPESNIQWGEYMDEEMYYES